MGEQQLKRRAERKRAEQAAEMRQDIVDAAFAAFAEHGIHQTGIADIAAQVGVSAGTLYNYFSNKREILEAVVDRILEQLLSTLAAHAPEEPATLEEYREQASRIASAVDDLFAADPRIVRMLLFEATAIDEALTERMLGLFDLAREVGSAYLRNGVQRGFLREDLDVAATADAITGMVLAAAIRAWRSSLGASDRAALEQAITQLLLDGARSRAPGCKG